MPVLRSTLGLNYRTHTALPRLSILLRPQPPVPPRHRIGPPTTTHHHPLSISRPFSSQPPSNMSFPQINTMVVCPALNLLPENTPPDLFASELAFFASLPWTAALLSAPETIPFLPACRNPASPLHDQFFGVSLNNARGLSHLISFFRAPSVDAARDPSRSITETITLVSVGDGVSGYPGVVHGGFVASLLDESMGMVFELNSALRKEARAFTTPNVTGGLDVTFLRPVPTNSELRITATVEEVDGRKTRIRGEITDEKGDVLAKCVSRWVALKSSL